MNCSNLVFATTLWWFVQFIILHPLIIALKHSQFGWICLNTIFKNKLFGIIFEIFALLMWCNLFKMQTLCCCSKGSDIVNLVPVVESLNYFDFIFIKHDAFLIGYVVTRTSSECSLKRKIKCTHFINRRECFMIWMYFCVSFGQNVLL